MTSESSRDTRVDDAASPPSTAEQPKKIPTGVVLGKDGKPCRSCTSFAAWAAQTKGQIKKDDSTNTPATSTSTSTSTAASLPTQPADCPPDVEALGRSSWTLLHTMAASYPEVPSRTQQSDMAGFVKLFSRLYPCWVCAEDFQAYIARDAPRVGSRRELGLWMCGAHNEVNRKLGKPEFDCSRWEERWRSGWKDGRCD